jgi:pSer/pThr/pTyr-binding forkhead associated (FHA) protein
MNYLEIYFNGVLKQSLPVKSNTLNIGRASSNEVIIDNMGVSSHHAVINIQDNMYFIEDLNSTNGTFLNSQKIDARQRINPQDSIIIGKHTLKFSEWGESYGSRSSAQNMESNDATVMISKSKVEEITQSTQFDSQEKQYYLVIRGDATGVNKLLLTENNYGIGKAKDNEIRLNGWFTAAYIAEIEKIGHSFYITPLKKNKVKLNDSPINSSTLLSVADKISIKNLFIKFLTD